MADKTGIAKERVELLFRKAKSVKSEKLAKRYVSLARKVAMRARYRLPKDLKRSFCKECNSLFKLGTNCIVRADSKNRAMKYTCLECKTVKRFKY